MKKILLYSYGNPIRSDDGLGNEFIKSMDQWIVQNNIQSVTTLNNFQLNVEDASVISEYDIVIFIDASKAEIESFLFQQLQPQTNQSFTSHSVSPASLIAVCQELYNRSPLVYLLQIKGYLWEFGEGLSAKGSKNLQKAIETAKSTIVDFQNQE